MVQQLNKRERRTHRAEHPGVDGMRVSIAIDNENQPRPHQRERTITYRARQAGHMDTEVTP